MDGRCEKCDNFGEVIENARGMQVCLDCNNEERIGYVDHSIGEDYEKANFKSISRKSGARNTHNEF